MTIRKRLITEEISMKDLFHRIGVEDKELAALTVPFPLSVHTPYGYNRIVTAFRTEKQKTVTTYFKNNTTLKTSEHHQLKINGGWKKVKDIVNADVVETESGTTSIKKKHCGNDEILYDISVEDVHCYYSNGILSHNSWLLCSLGAKAMAAGKNVAHFTLELNENYVGLRYDCCFTGINFQDIKHHQSTVEQKLKSIKGRLFVKYFPLKTVSAQSLKFHVERIQTLNNFKIDEIVVDYADILRPLEKEKNSNSYSEGGSIYEELRQIAGELQLPIWTASQANRTALGEDIVQAQNVSDSYRKIMTADFVLSLSRNIDDKANNTARFHVIKNRFGPDGITLYSNMDTGTGNIQIFDAKSRESMAIQANMQEDSNSVKNLLKNKWNSHRQNEKGNDSSL
jgi:hypothetical protein